MTENRSDEMQLRTVRLLENQNRTV